MKKSKLVLAAKAIAAKTITMVPNGERTIVVGSTGDDVVVYTVVDGTVPTSFSISSDAIATIDGAISEDEIQLSINNKALTVSAVNSDESVDLAIDTENLCSPVKKPNKEGITLDAVKTATALKQLGFALVKKDNRASISHSKWHVEENGFRITAFDGYSVSRAFVSANTAGLKDFYVPASAMSVLSSFMPKKDGSCTMWVDEDAGLLFFSINNLIAICISIRNDIDYPNIERLINADYPNSFKAESNELKAMLKRMPFIKKAKENANIIFDFSNGKVSYRVAAAVSVVKGELAVSDINIKNPVKIKMSGKLWYDIITSAIVDNETVTFSFDRPQGILIVTCGNSTFATRSA